MPNPSSYNCIATADRLLRKAGLCPEKNRIVDCGSGLGIALIYFSKKGWRSNFGIEGSSAVFLASWLVTRTVGSSSMLVWGDWRKKWPEAAVCGDILFFYQCQEGMKQLSDFLKSFQGEVWIISHTFSLLEKKPIAFEVAHGLYKSPVYLYHFSNPTSNLAS